VRKIEVDNNGNIFHVFEIYSNDKTVPGIEIDESASDFHQEFINNHKEYIDIYKYKNNKIVKRSLDEFKSIKQNKLNMYNNLISKLEVESRLEELDNVKKERDDLQTLLLNIKQSHLDKYPDPPTNIIKGKGIMNDK